MTFVFNDSQNEVGRFWRVIVQNVNQPPTNVRINSPLWPRLNYTSGDKIMFTAAVALDPDDPNATLTYQWKDGGTVIHTGMSFDTTKLTVGRHAIVLSVTDPDGDTVEAGVTVNIKPAPSKPFIPGMDALAALGALGLLAAVAVALRRRK